MLKPRIIPCLLLSNNGLVKTIRFKKPTYIGDPINVLSIFNDFEVDEIVLLDIFATVQDRPPMFELLERMANECMIPIAYGGGIRSVEDAARIFKIGVEKIIFNTCLSTHPEIIRSVVKHFGAQAVVASLDAKPRWFGRGYNAYVKRGSQCFNTNIVETAKYVEALGVGEIFLQAIHREGTYMGFDLPLIHLVSEAVSIPVIACGGAKDRNNLCLPIERGASAVAASSLFVFQSIKRGILINYPSKTEINSLLNFN